MQKRHLIWVQKDIQESIYRVHVYEKTEHLKLGLSSNSPDMWPFQKKNPTSFRESLKRLIDLVPTYVKPVWKTTATILSK